MATDVAGLLALLADPSVESVLLSHYGSPYILPRALEIDRNVTILGELLVTNANATGAGANVALDMVGSDGSMTALVAQGGPFAFQRLLSVRANVSVVLTNLHMEGGFHNASAGVLNAGNLKMTGAPHILRVA